MIPEQGSTTSPGKCLPEEMLEQYVVCRPPDRAPEANEAIEHHLAQCPACAERVAALREAAARIAEELARTRSGGVGTPPSDELLGRYLDGNLKGEERAVLEAHLAHCGACQQRLVALYREVQAACDSTAPLSTVESHESDVCPSFPARQQDGVCAGREPADSQEIEGADGGRGTQKRGIL